MAEPIALEDYVLSFFLASARKGSFNGARALDAVASCSSKTSLQTAVAQLVEAGKIDCVFARRDINPHIKRLPVLPKEKQLEWIRTEELNTYCLYPSSATLAAVVGPTELADQPFSRAMLLGEAQLSFATFELSVLGRYRSDPRFSVKFHDYMGDMSISDTYYSDPEVLDRDKISVNSFGLGIDGKLIPHILVFYRYLADLTPEHQQYWNSFRAVHVPMCEQYFQSSVVGDWWENRSVRYAIQEEMRLVNEMATAAFSAAIFRSEMTDDLPFDLSAFLVPSTQNFATFIHSWDKLLSDNLNHKFFAGKVDLTFEEKRADERISVRDKGTILLLEQWLKAFVTGKDSQAIIDAVIGPLQRIRKLRQQPAHSFQKNEFSDKFHAERRRVLSEVLDSIGCLRKILSRHPKAGGIDVPEWLDSGEVHIF